MTSRKNFRVANNVKVQAVVTPALHAAIRQDANDNFTAVSDIVAVRLAAVYAKELPPTKLADTRQETLEADLLLKRYKADRIRGNVLTVDFVTDLINGEMLWLKRNLDQLAHELATVCPDQKEVIERAHKDALFRISDLPAKAQAAAIEFPPPTVDNLPTPPKPPQELDFG